MQPAFCFYAGWGWGSLPRPAACVAFMQVRIAPCMYYFVYVDKICPNVDLCCITRIFYVPLWCLRISGNAEERPPNVKTTLRQGRPHGVILTVAFLFTIISQPRKFNLAYCLLFERFTIYSSVKQI